MRSSCQIGCPTGATEPTTYLGTKTIIREAGGPRLNQL